MCYGRCIQIYIYLPWRFIWKEIEEKLEETWNLMCTRFVEPHEPCTKYLYGYILCNRYNIIVEMGTNLLVRKLIVRSVYFLLWVKNRGKTRMRRTREHKFIWKFSMQVIGPSKLSLLSQDLLKFVESYELFSRILKKRSHVKERREVVVEKKWEIASFSLRPGTLPSV